jgi:hypothetical protein
MAGENSTPERPPRFSPRRIVGGLLMMAGGLAGMGCGLLLMRDGFGRLGGGAAGPEPFPLAALTVGLAAGAASWGLGKWIAGPLPPGPDGRPLA